jgi:NTE family protein
VAPRLRFACLPLCAAILSGCATIYDAPINLPLASAKAATFDAGSTIPTKGDDLLIALAFSGGGSRAAAFSYGVLLGIDRTQAASVGRNIRLLDSVHYVSGVSGGAITAAYFGLRGRSALSDFPNQFLLRDAEESLSTPFTPLGMFRAYQGGTNDAQQFTHWLDQNVFQGATFGQLNTADHPHILIYASDVYNRTPFVFNTTTFGAICSDLNAYPIANAVAASAAMPLIFAPMVLTSYGDRCRTTLPKWVTETQNSKDASPLLKASAEAIVRYRNGSVPFIKLLDGGVVDFYGLSGFTITRLAAEAPYEPLTAQQAVKIRRILFLVVDAGKGPSGDWVQSIEGPSAPELLMAAANTATDSSARLSFTAFDRTMSEWRETLVHWRCGLSQSERQGYGLPGRWDCRDLKFLVGHLDFDQLGAQRSLELNSIPTRFKLSPEDVEKVVIAGQDALRTNPTFRAFLGSLGGPAVAVPSAAARP